MENADSRALTSRSMPSVGVSPFCTLIRGASAGTASVGSVSIPSDDAPFDDAVSSGRASPTSVADSARRATAVSLTVAGTVGVVTGLLFTLSEFLRFIPAATVAQVRGVDPLLGSFAVDPYAVATSPVLDFLEHAVGPVAVTTTAAAVTALALAEYFRRPGPSAPASVDPPPSVPAPSVPDGSTVGRVDVDDCARCEADYEAALRRAEEAARERSRFMALVSHELRTPLNAIIGFSQIIREEAAEVGAGMAREARHADYAGEIQASGERLLHLVNEMLELTALDRAGTGAGRGADAALAPEVVDVAETVEAARRAVADRLAATGLRLDVRIADDARRLHAEPRALRRIVDHLLSNAIRFTSSGGSVTIAARRWGRKLELVVADTGVGIPADRIAGVFDPFQHGSSRTGRPRSVWRSDGPDEGAPSVVSGTTSGAGLGLALVKATTDALGGTVRIESGGAVVSGDGAVVRRPGVGTGSSEGGDVSGRVGRGTTVTVTLPLR